MIRIESQSHLDKVADRVEEYWMTVDDYRQMVCDSYLDHRKWSPKTYYGLQIKFMEQLKKR